MIRITNMIGGKLYELVPNEHNECDRCAFNGGLDCTIPKEHRYHYGDLACLKFHGIWKEVKDEKQYEYGVESFYNGHWIIEQTGFDELCEAKDSIDVHQKNYPEDKLRIVRREIGKWEVVENEKAN